MHTNYIHVEYVASSSQFFIIIHCFTATSFFRNISSHFQVGFSHSNILRTIVHRACLRFPNLASYSSASGHLPGKSNASRLAEALNKPEGIHKVFVIFGGDTSERQVSLMSGTNVWLNLLAFSDVSLDNLNYILFLFV